MVAGTFLKLIGVWDISSDWFWFLAGVGVVVESIIALSKQKRFDNKYKIIEIKKGVNNLVNNFKRSLKDFKSKKRKSA